MPDLSVEHTPVPGLLVVRLDRRPDSRGWFEEAWQRAKMTALGMPDFGPVQANVSWNATRGTTRGVHAEPWDKLVTIAHGSAFGSWVDLRKGESFGSTFDLDLEPGVAVFVPRGVGNSYQTLEDATVYVYLVNDHWRPGPVYPALNLDDPTVAIPWPIPLSDAEISDKDLAAPKLDQVTPMSPRRTLIVGSRGQLGRALAVDFPEADRVDLDELDVTDPAAVAAWPWHEYAFVLNAAGYTAVDAAETPDGRVSAWAANAAAPAALARVATEHHLTLVHYSTDYVFDGTRPDHTEDEPVSPLGVYGQAKAAGDLAVGTTRQHYLLRTSWVIGEGKNFVRTMLDLAGRGVDPRVVHDQIGRLTFAEELSRATRHLLDTGAPCGTYNATNAGEPRSWAELAEEVFEAAGRDRGDVTRVSTEDYAAGKVVSPRPRNGVLDLAKLRATGFEPGDHLEALRAYCSARRP